MMEEKYEDWAVFGRAPWDNEQLVARSRDGIWIYPAKGFEPTANKYYYLALILKFSKREIPYYIGKPRYGQQAAEIPPEVQKLIRRLEDLEFENFHLKTENEALVEKIKELKSNTKQQDISFGVDRAVIAAMLKHCSLEDLLGNDADRQSYRRVMQVVHPDKLHGLGPKLYLILEELTKAINEKYRR